MRANSARERAVAGDESASQRFTERNIHCVVRRKVVPQLEDSMEQGQVAMPRERKVAVRFERLVRTFDRHAPAKHGAPQD